MQLVLTAFSFFSFFFFFETGWVVGKIGDKCGLVPGNFLQEMPSSSERMRTRRRSASVSLPTVENLDIKVIKSVNDVLQGRRKSQNFDSDDDNDFGSDSGSADSVVVGEDPPQQQRQKSTQLRSWAVRAKVFKSQRPSGNEEDGTEKPVSRWASRSAPDALKALEVIYCSFFFPSKCGHSLLFDPPVSV